MAYNGRNNVTQEVVDFVRANRHRGNEEYLAELVQSHLGLQYQASTMKKILTGGYDSKFPPRDDYDYDDDDDEDYYEDVDDEDYDEDDEYLEDDDDDDFSQDSYSVQKVARKKSTAPKTPRKKSSAPKTARKKSSAPKQKKQSASSRGKSKSQGGQQGVALPPIAKTIGIVLLCLGLFFLFMGAERMIGLYDNLFTLFASGMMFFFAFGMIFQNDKAGSLGGACLSFAIHCSCMSLFIEESYDGKYMGVAAISLAIGLGLAWKD